MYNRRCSIATDKLRQTCSGVVVLTIDISVTNALFDIWEKCCKSEAPCFSIFKKFKHCMQSCDASCQRLQKHGCIFGLDQVQRQ